MAKFFSVEVTLSTFPFTWVLKLLTLEELSMLEIQEAVDL